MMCWCTWSIMRVRWNQHSAMVLELIDIELSAFSSTASNVASSGKSSDAPSDNSRETRSPVPPATMVSESPALPRKVFLAPTTSASCHKV